MDGGIEEYKGREMDWAVDTVFHNAEEVGLLRRHASARELIEAVWDFLAQVYGEEGFGELDRKELTKRVESELPGLLEQQLQD